LINLFQIFFSITILFFVLVGIKQFLKGKTKDKFCAICIAVSITWIGLLIVYWTGLFKDNTIVAILIGQSSLGIFYIWEKKARESVKIFRLPFLLSLILTDYTLIEGISYSTSVIYFILVLWIFFVVIYVFRKNVRIRKFVKKMVECCKKW